MLAGQLLVNCIRKCGSLATFANGGVTLTLPNRNYYNSNGNVVYQHQTQKERVFDEDVAYVIADILKDATTTGAMASYNSQMDSDLDWFMKTGTSEEFRDLWANGSTPNVTFTSWIGYDNITQTRDLYSQAENAFGTSSTFINYWTTLGNH